MKFSTNSWKTWNTWNNKLGLILLSASVTFLACAATTTDTTQPVLTETRISPPDNPIEIWQVCEPDRIGIYARSKSISEATITCFVSGERIRVDPPEPRPHGLSKDDRDAVRVIRPMNSHIPYSFSVRYQSHIGVNGGYPDREFIYALPFDSSRPLRIGQAARGPTHIAGSPSENAIDFEMPVGSAVCAAREGTVVAVKDDSDIGGPDLNLKDKGNYVVIKHEDNSYAEYQHLKRQGVLVHLGQRVHRNQKLALSGNTGASSGPHLHFCVFYFDDMGQHLSVLPRFETTRGIYFPPKTGDMVGAIP